MRRILITGGTGFIGRNLVEQLREDYALEAPTHGELDLLDRPAVHKYLERHQFDVVLHSATHDATAMSTKDRSQVLSANLAMFYNLARCNELYGKMFYFGSGAEYDAQHYVPLMEETYFGTHIPADDYGLSKYVMAKFAESSTNIFNLRLFGCFGKYEDWRIRFISHAICRTLFDLNITIRQNVYFDYLYVNDLVSILRSLLERDSLRHHCYNVCTASPVDLASLAELVRRISGKQVDIEIGAPGLKREYTGNNARLRWEMGELAFTPLEIAVQNLYSWYDAHRDLIDISQLA